MVGMAMPTDHGRGLELVEATGMTTVARRGVMTLMLERVVRGLAVGAALTVVRVAAQVEEGVGAAAQALTWLPAAKRRGRVHGRRTRRRKSTGIV